MKTAIYRLCCAALPLFLLPLEAQAQRRPCITDAEIEAEIGPQVRSGALLVDASRIDNGRPLCTGGTIAQRIHRMREDVHPEERAARLDRQAFVRAEVARLAAEWEADKQAERDLQRLQQVARLAEARRDAAFARREEAEARASTSEAELRDARARRKLAALPPPATIPIADERTLRPKLESLILQDADYWLRREYAPDSVYGVSLETRDWAGQVYDLYGKFRYRDGGTGSVRVQFRGGAFDCIQFQDDWTCRDIGNPMSRQIVGFLGKQILLAIVRRI